MRKNIKDHFKNHSLFGSIQNGMVSLDALTVKKENMFMKLRLPHQLIQSCLTFQTFSASVTVIHEKKFQMPQVCDEERISNITDSCQLQPQR